MNKMINAYKKWKCSLSIKNKILYSNILIIGFGLTFTLLSGYYLANREFVNKFAWSSNQLLEQINMNIEAKINEFSDMTVNFYLSSDVGDKLNYRCQERNGNRYERNNAIESFAFNIFSYNQYVNSVIFQDLSGEVSYVNREDINSIHQNFYFDKLPVEEIEKMNGKLVWSICDDCVYASRILYNKKTLKKVGFLSFEISREFMEEIYNGLVRKQTNMIVLVDKNGRALFGSDKLAEQLVKSVIHEENLNESLENLIYYNEKKYVYSIKKVHRQNLFTMDIIKYDQITKDTRIIFYPFLIALALAIVISGIIAQRTSAVISNSINRLIYGMARISNGDFSEHIEIEGKDEISVLADKFNFMTDEIKRLLDEIVNERIKSSESELKALQFEYDALSERINPHFLYNILESINSMAKLNGDGRISRAILLLSSYFRNMVNTKQEFITLEEEICNIKTYLNLQKLVYGERVQYDFQVDSILREILVPRFLVQPLVENAVIHGILPKQEGGQVLIKVGCEKKNAIIEVCDDGVGIPACFLKDGLVYKKRDDKHHRVGVVTVEKRIKLLYGKDFGLNISNAVNGGASAKIRIPIIFEEDCNV